MIPNQWYAILDSKEVRSGKPVGVTRMGEKLVAWRDSKGQVTVMRDLCPHRGVALSAGELQGRLHHVPVPRLRVRHQRPLHGDPGQRPERAGAQGIPGAGLSHARGARVHLHLVGAAGGRSAAAPLLRRHRRELQLWLHA